MGERITSWEQEAAFKGVKEIKPREGGGQEIKHESAEEINERNQKLVVNLGVLEAQMHSTEDPEKRNLISRKILNLVAGRVGEDFFEARKQQANT